jgi:hypothetical protein
LFGLKHTKSFEDIKKALVTALVLALPNIQKAFMIKIDASKKYGIGKYSCKMATLLPS